MTTAALALHYRNGGCQVYRYAKSSGPILPRDRDFLSPGVYDLERDLDGNTGGSKL